MSVGEMRGMRFYSCGFSEDTSHGHSLLFKCFHILHRLNGHFT